MWEGRGKPTEGDAHLHKVRKRKRKGTGQRGKGERERERRRFNQEVSLAVSVVPTKAHAPRTPSRAARALCVCVRAGVAAADGVWKWIADAPTKPTPSLPLFFLVVDLLVRCFSFDKRTLLRAHWLGFDSPYGFHSHHMGRDKKKSFLGFFFLSSSSPQLSDTQAEKGRQR